MGHARSQGTGKFLRGFADQIGFNGGIGGNEIAGPPDYGADKPFPGGPASSQRLDRDVLGLSGIRSLIRREGINDFSKNGNAMVDQVTLS